MKPIPDGNHRPRSKFVLDTDAPNFERAMRRLCAAFDVPLTDPRREAYWRSFRRLEMLEFTGLVDMALVESQFASLPTVGALWELHRKHAPATKAPANTAPSVVEQLANFAMRTVGKSLTPGELARPWTYVHRAGQVSGVLIERDNGARLRITTDGMHAGTFEP